MWQEQIDRWESYTIYTIEWISHTLDNISITNFIENLLGTTTIELLNSWKLNFPKEYQSMIEMTDNAYNVTEQVRQIILVTNPSRETLYYKMPLLDI